MGNPVDDCTQPLALIPPTAADRECAAWMQHGKRLADKRDRRERAKESR